MTKWAATAAFENRIVRANDSNTHTHTCERLVVRTFEEDNKERRDSSKRGSAIKSRRKKSVKKGRAPKQEEEPRRKESAKRRNNVEGQRYLKARRNMSAVESVKAGACRPRNNSTTNNNGVAFFLAHEEACYILYVLSLIMLWLRREQKPFSS